VRVLPGEDIEWFADDVLHQLQSAPYQIGTESNRMGYRLDGPACRRACGDHYLSSATYLGAIQVPGPGHLILLMADRPTTGGYPKVATTIAADVGRVAQCAPGELVRFEVCDAETARCALDEWEQALAEIEVRSV
jgi:allophanate hydrolase subunit 2